MTQIPPTEGVAMPGGHGDDAAASRQTGAVTPAGVDGPGPALSRRGGTRRILSAVCEAVTHLDLALAYLCCVIDDERDSVPDAGWHFARADMWATEAARLAEGWPR